MSDARYFLALVPPEPHFSKIMELKQEVAATFESKGALRSPPHITLQMPFLWKESKRQLLYDHLAEFKFPEFELTINDYGFFEPRESFLPL